MNTDPKHSSRYGFAKASGKPLTCCYVGCDEPATVDVFRANAFFCDHHYVLNIARIGCDLNGTPIGSITTHKDGSPKKGAQ